MRFKKKCSEIGKDYTEVSCSLGAQTRVHLNTENTFASGYFCPGFFGFFEIIFFLFLDCGEC